MQMSILYKRDSQKPVAFFISINENTLKAKGKRNPKIHVVTYKRLDIPIHKNLKNSFIKVSP